jgi:UDP-N-acetylmuramate dehydrogenase
MRTAAEGAEMMAALETPEVTGELRENEPMSQHTSWRVGGPADLFFRPASVSDLSGFLNNLDSSVPVFWFGLGSNLLVRDGGLPGVVIAAAGIFKDLEKVGEQRVRAGASVPCTQLARQCIRWGFGPSEFFAGIPGTLGGALAMNAGAHGNETWERVRSVSTIDRQGELHTREPRDYEIAYRSVTGPANEWFIEAELQFDAATNASMDTLREMLARRKDTQPLGLPSCGSVFRNPPGEHAARLIDACGLKGCRIGDAEVSEKHANFIINRGDASALDVENLILHVQQMVADSTGVELVPEVRIVGRESS